MMAYAAKTTVPAERTRNEIEAMLRKYGAQEFGYATRPGRAAIQFSMHGRQIRMEIALPLPTDPEIIKTETGKRRTQIQRDAAHDQATRQRWRALLLVAKAKLEAVEAGIVTFEQEFLAHTLLPSGRTVFEETAPGIAEMYAGGGPASLLQIGGA